ncbi:MAG: bifunctional DedA family/phosphatase PAP2 family protein, partial [Frankiales bacterium]|nr:bifunctional DedA family/phosphatase PAP2 family protein [Frankiales bacterium]
MLSSVVDSVLSLSGIPAYALVALLVAGEAAAFLGVFLPGEIALLLGGVLASQGRVSLPVLLVVACTAAVVGDSIGYEVGRYGGPALQRSRLGRLVGEQRWETGQRFLERRGGPAVLLGRWVGVLRALVPSLAGIGRMPYRQFLAWNATGGVIWASTVVLVGNVAGAQYPRVEHLLGRASLLAGALAVTAVVAVLVVRRRPSVGGLMTVVRRRSDRLVGSVASWADPQAAVGVVLGTGLVTALITGAAFTVVTEDVLEGGGVTFLDRPLLRLLAGHRTALLTALARTATFLGSVPMVLLVAALVAVALWRRDRWSAALLVVAVVGSGALTFAAKLLVHRDRPALPLAIDGSESGFAFPSGHSLTSLVLYASLAYLLVTRGRSRPGWLRVVGVTLLLLVPVAVGASRVYLGYHWLTDVAGSWTLAALWLTAVVTADRLLRGRA